MELYGTTSYLPGTQIYSKNCPLAAPHLERTTLATLESLWMLSVSAATCVFAINCF